MSLLPTSHSTATSATSPLLGKPNKNTANDDRFGALLEAAANAPAAKPADKVEKTPANTTIEEFLKFARMTPAERIRDSYLKSHNLTEDSLKAMDSAQRTRIEEEIKTAIRQKFAEQAKGTGSVLG